MASAQSVDAFGVASSRAEAPCGTHDDKYRIRQGDYRVLYEIDDDNKRVTIVRVAHRRGVYR